ncbi:S1 RNA-binding domain-containing protein 1 [Galleria mellonella]|uniref:S1 RNA-binding domain-containing protein 1 n=1 Tax=Galleria mellonella TaxID=7137 RepID=A0A6J1WRL2_GALME|nr:S1 RNA-binding domain-containing protein 1 [Galleria mellonella]XP_026757956.2 S1 RNA-binding domain-containing protein 1 [Galleria mellonella]XP_031768187.2 S1 RNA-binding domain-containing protein 1 [Galleria mellonella]XP_052757413.1 S1 RNA-binding domain-containing protein 1 [Galleria mellonella]XP_052757414.1 S1 RNA-binding domain-containing protein 1 [Galleria mellonella]
MADSISKRKRKVQDTEKESEVPIMKNKPRTRSPQNIKECKGNIKSKEEGKLDDKVPSKKMKRNIEIDYSDKTTFTNSNDDSENTVIEDDEAAILSHIEKIPQKLAHNFISLLSQGCTLPFIARYRKEAVDFLMPDRLQELFESYQNVTQLKKKIKSVIETLRKSKKLTPDVEKSILNAKSLPEIDLVYAPLKSHSLSLAERARNLGLESYAVAMLNGQYIDLKSLCTDDEELSSVEKVDTHITHIIADVIYKDIRVLEQMRKLKEETRFIIQSSRTKSSTKVKVDSSKKIDSKSDPETYELYFQWSCPCQFVKPHQILAINRGEDEKILSVKVIIPDWFYNKLERFCLTLWKSKHWVCKGLGDAFNRLIKPWLSRQVRSDLTSVAQKEAVRTFTTNLEKYLLTEPIKNRTIAGLDPGFKAGCKVGIINPNGDKIEVCTIHPNLRQNNQHDPAVIQLKYLLQKYRVELISLGNGTACRETESWLKAHHVAGNIPIVIVPEQGASIYSISKEAQKEHPNMDPNLISALSIARRVLDPLGELIKVDPKNLGVGLYQHDIPPKMMESALDCTVEKVVSLVGVDINTASQAMLRRIAGLSEGRAKKILAYRQDNGGFTTRAEILKVSGIGKTTYQQCAGFLRVVGGTEPLDATIIHPESYSIAKSFAKKIGVNIKELTQPHFPQLVESKVYTLDIEKMSKDLGSDISTLELIIGAFKQKTNEDNIISFCRPVYSLNVQGVDQLQEGMTLTGVVRNVVPFGCFVDCGIGENGLIHRSKLGGSQTPKLGDRVSVTVIPSNKPKKIQLKLEKILD